MRVGKQMQFFGARVNAAKALLYAINGGRDEMSGKQVMDRATNPSSQADGPLDFDDVWKHYEEMLDWVVGTYVEALNIIHYCHDRYAYEAIEMALHDAEIVRTMGCGIAGLSIVADSLAAIKYAKVYPIRRRTCRPRVRVCRGDETAWSSTTAPRATSRSTATTTIAPTTSPRPSSTPSWTRSRLPIYRDAIPTQSVLTITSNVVYGKATGSFPSGHDKGTPYAPGANPENGMDTHGMVASMLSVGKLDYNDALDGISLTNTITPQGLGRDEDERVTEPGRHPRRGQRPRPVPRQHQRAAQGAARGCRRAPGEVPAHLTVRVSPGYAVNFVKLTKEQQLDVISRTFHQGAVVD